MEAIGYLPTSFWLNWVFQNLNWVFQIFEFGYPSESKYAMKAGLVSLDFFVYFRFHFQKAHWQYKYIWDRYFILISKNQRIYQVIFDSSNHQCSIRVSYDMIFNCSGAFSPMLRHCYCKECRYCVNIGYS